jgi:hypothetical protein
MRVDHQLGKKRPPAVTASLEESAPVSKSKPARKTAWLVAAFVAFIPAVFFGLNAVASNSIRSGSRRPLVA